MTQAATPRVEQSTTSRPEPSGPRAKASPGQLGVGIDPAFAQLLFGLGLAPVGPGGGVSEGGEREEEAEGERHDEAEERGERSDEGEGDAESLPDSPLTIDSLNETLLTGGPAPSPLMQDVAGRMEQQGRGQQGRATRSESNAGAAAGRGAEGGDGAGEKAGQGAPEPAPRGSDPFAALVRASQAVRGGEGAGGAATNMLTGNGQAPTVQPTAQPAAGVGAPVVALQAAGGAGGGSGGSGGSRGTGAAGTGGTAPATGVGLGAQGSRVGASALRVTPAPAGSPERSQAGAEAFRAQVSRGLASALQRGEGTFTLRLKPEALGKLQVRVEMKDGVLSARFEAQTDAARDLLKSSIGDLRRSLEAAGVSVERIEATVAPKQEMQGPQAEPGSAPGDRLGADGGAFGEGGGASDPGGEHGSARGERDRDDALLPGETEHPADQAAEPWPGGRSLSYLGVDTIA